MTITPPDELPRPSFFKRNRKAFSALLVGFGTGVSGSLVMLAQAQVIDAAHATNDILNTLFWGAGSAIAAAVAVHATSNEIDPQGVKFKALFRKAVKK